MEFPKLIDEPIFTHSSPFTPTMRVNLDNDIPVVCPTRQLGPNLIDEPIFTHSSPFTPTMRVDLDDDIPVDGQLGSFHMDI